MKQRVLTSLLCSDHAWRVPISTTTATRPQSQTSAIWTPRDEWARPRGTPVSSRTFAIPPYSETVQSRRGPRVLHLPGTLSCHLVRDIDRHIARRSVLTLGYTVYMPLDQ